GGPARQGRGEPGARQAPVATDDDGLLARLQRLRAEGAAQVLGKTLVEGLADDAADVVGLEDGGGNLHRGPSSLIGAGQPRSWLAEPLPLRLGHLDLADVGLARLDRAAAVAAGWRRLGDSAPI